MKGNLLMRFVGDRSSDAPTSELFVVQGLVDKVWSK